MRKFQPDFLKQTTPFFITDMRKVTKVEADTNIHTHAESTKASVQPLSPHFQTTLFPIQRLCLDCPVGKTACQGVHPLVWSVFAQMPSVPSQHTSTLFLFNATFCLLFPKSTLLFLVTLNLFHAICLSDALTDCKRHP